MIKKKIISIILARGGSKGIKNKNLIKINNKPLIYWSIKSCLNSKFIDQVWVSSDSDKILKISKKFGANVIKRPREFAKDNSSSEVAWLHAVNELNKKILFDTVVGIQPTSPIRPYTLLDKAITKYQLKNYDSLFTSEKILDYNIWEFKNKSLIANYNYKKRPRRQEIKEKFLENGSFYIFNRRGFQRNKCRLFGKIGTFEMDKVYSFQIDEKKDIKLFNNLKVFYK